MVGGKDFRWTTHNHQAYESIAANPYTLPTASPMNVQTIIRRTISTALPRRRSLGKFPPSFTVSSDLPRNLSPRRSLTTTTDEEGTAEESSKDPKAPENELEKSLLQAFDNPAHRPQFVQNLLDEPVYFLGTEGEDGKMKEIHSWLLPVKDSEPPETEAWIPFWSAISRIYETEFPAGTSFENVVVYPVPQGRQFFERTQGSHIVLCSGALGIHKDFYPHEIDQMLDGSLGKPTSHKLEPGAEVYVGKPAKWPSKAVASLSDFMQKLVQDRGPIVVQKAWLGYWITSTTDKIGTYVMGLQVSSNKEDEIQELFAKIGHILESGHPGVVVDLTVWTKDEEPNPMLKNLVSEEAPFFDAEAMS